MDNKGNTPAEFYGAPTIIHETVSLDASGILDRPIGAVRVNKDFNAETDALAKLLCEVTGTTSRLVSGVFDGTRPMTIVDARLLTYTPETLQRTVDALIN